MIIILIICTCIIIIYYSISIVIISPVQSTDLEKYRTVIWSDGLGLGPDCEDSGPWIVGLRRGGDHGELFLLKYSRSTSASRSDRIKLSSPPPSSSSSFVHSWDSTPTLL